MASTIAASTAGGGGIIQTADASGNLNLQSGTTTILALTSTGVAITGTLSATGVLSATSPTFVTPVIDSATVATVSGTAPLYMCRAWVNFNGTGTVAIRASGNVSSITDNGSGDYTVNFTTAMPDANYCAVFSVSTVWGTALPCPQLSTIVSSSSESAPTSSAVRVANTSLTAGTTGYDPKYCNVSIFR